MERKTNRIENAVDEVLKAGLRTLDIYVDGTKLITGSQMRDEIIARL